jgi:uncharacterized protein (DUF58 family)
MIKTFYLNRIVYYILGGAAVIFLLSYFLPAFFRIAVMILPLLLVVVLIDTILLYSRKQGFDAQRSLSERFSIGDINKVVLHLTNQYPFPVRITVIDEIPFQFQERKWLRKVNLAVGEKHELEYSLRPVTRGEYIFHDTNVYVHGPLQLVKRRYIFPLQRTIKVYPSYMQMRRFQLLAVANKLEEAGVKRMQRIGHSMEFEQIKEYVLGDDYRTINWKATARKDGLMVNNYTDERSQQIYCLINKGRVMKMPFNGLTLLDHAINASLVLSNVALVKQDRAGLITFAENLDSFLLAPALKKIAHYHLLLVVFFENTELKSVIEKKAHTLEDIYIKTIAEKFAYEKRLMVKELHMNGIPSILTTPENLTVNTVNKYLELKTRMSI